MTGGRLDAIWIKRAHRGPMDPVAQASPGLEGAMYPEWRGGAFGELLDYGVIAVGDPVSWTET